MTRISAAVRVGALLLVCGCGTPARTTPIKRGPMPVNASFDRTWNAAIDMFAKWNIPVPNQDRKAGMMASVGVLVTGADSTWADCGRTQGGDQGRPQLPNVGRYVATIKGDSVASSIQVTPTWVSGSGAIVKDCVSRGIWESQFERDVKAKAEQP
jgi:hypothetical protein